jgi:hypothetical protein
MTANEQRPSRRIPTLGTLRTGARIERRVERLSLGGLPARLERVQRAARLYRAGLERAVVLSYGEIDTPRAHAINLAASAEMQAMIGLWCLRNRMDTMSSGDILACSASITKARRERDAAVKVLGLDSRSIAQHRQDTMFAEMYEPLEQPPALPEPPRFAPDEREPCSASDARSSSADATESDLGPSESMTESDNA